MKALVLKDLYVLSRQMKAFLLMIVIFTVVPGMNMTIFAVIYAAMMPYTALAYDERSHWDQMAGMMPYSVREIVLSKYVLGWLFTGGVALLSMAAGAIEGLFGAKAMITPSSAGMAFCMGALMIALTLPPMFRFGVEKGRMVFIIVMVFIACGSAGLVSGIMETGLSPLVSALTLILPAAAILGTLISVPLSQRMYRRRLYA